LRRMGWSTLTVWECDIKRPEHLLRRVTSYLGRCGPKVNKGRSS
jgi:G:T-mismatch repair DNA endonuclease (very short patch repair protein)